MCGHAADAVLVEQVAEGADGEFEEFGGARLVAVGAAQGFEQVGLLKLIEVRGEIEPAVGQVEGVGHALRAVARDVIGQAFGLDRFGALKRELILRCLEKTGGNKRQAARLLNLSRTTFIDKLQRLNVEDVA